MYIYELPFEVNRELCRLLDNDENWKELAGVYMKYSAFDINEMEQIARRQAVSPTSELFTRWGQLNHRVEELFILLYKMRHVPAMYCLRLLVGDRYLRLLTRVSSNGRNGIRENGSVDENCNRPNGPTKPEASQAFIPRPVVELEQGIQRATSSGVVHSPDNSTRDSSSVTSSTDSRSTGPVNDEFMRQVSAVPLLKYEDLREATENWSDANLLGRGGFGQVYKGEWKLLTVAVKRLANNDGKNRELIREMCLNQYRHDNILPLYGYSLGGPEACLVYQLMAGGSLEQRIRCKTHFPPLSWTQRHRIAHGVARGLQFLHTMTGTPLIHGDIKPANILLDQCGIPKIGDFGLARKGPYGEDRTHLKVSKVHGTRAYLPEEYLVSHCLSPAVDVFSFGVVLLELACALPAADRGRPRPLLSDHVHHAVRGAHDTAYLEDRMIIGTELSNPHLCREFIAIGIHCTSYARHQRPTMLQVFKRLDNMQFNGKDTA
ncbi:serine/threonine-protein kinase pelle isoform X2 [Pectinophora gossypiella]|uniref:serine/threonine-protein kinase pelle isoform X1 n=1 Tax=Pectinophora gossypiella TaxID=13191 RepID=UPI00214EB29C|nr:serine/threonine-protein kinase pelle isoform X1 [Pectinophora gossypiella]XP_049880707.1 serine/threonine-protein kinase pelle isoform X2 [Pectinophora gossypiella]